MFNTINNNNCNSINYNRSRSAKKTLNVLSAVVGQSSNQNKYQLKFQDNSSIEVEKSQIKANIGDSINVKVEEKGNNKYFVQQVVDNMDIAQEGELLQKMQGYSIDEENYSGFLNDNGLENSAENIRTLGEIKRNIESIINSGGEVSVGTLLAMGVDIGNISIDALTKFIYQANNSTSISQDSNIQSVQDYIKQHPEIGQDETKVTVIDALINKGLPINESNIEQMSSLLENGKNIQGLTDEEIITVLKQNKPITAENIYSAKFSNSIMGKNTLDENIWNELKGQVSKILENSGLENNDENISNAKMLIENQIPVTGENIQKISFLRNPEIDTIELAKAGAECIAEGKNTINTDIFKAMNGEFDEALFNDYQDVIENIVNVKTSDIQNVINKNLDINIKNIIAETKNNNAVDIENISPEAITSKRQLLEIQLKLTVEASNRLAGKGIDINTMPLKEAISNLKNIENQIYKEELQNNGVEANKTTTDILAQSIRCVKALDLFTNESQNYSLIFNKINSPTINEIAENVINNNSRIFDTIENMATGVSAKYGDSFSKVSEQIADVLEQNQIEINDENLRAGEILARNNIDITDENITKVKLTDLKISYVYDKLHPMTAINMLKEGINPLETSLDDIVDFIKDYSQQYNQEDKDKIAEYIMDIDNGNQLDDIQRNAVTSIYRALSFVSKNNGKSIGAAAINDADNTIGSILEMAKAMQKARKGIDKSIDDNSEIKTTNVNSESIINNINEALSQNATELESLKKQYNEMLLNRLIDIATPNEVIKFVNGKEKVDNETIQSIYNGLREIAKNQDSFISQTKMQSLINDIQEMNGVGNNVISWLNDNNIALSINNINNMAKLLKDAFSSGKELNEVKTELENQDIKLENEFGYDESEIYSASQKAIGSIENAEEEVYQIEDLEKVNLILKQTTAIKNSLKLQKEINESDDNDVFQVPIRLNDDSITNLNMFVINFSKNDNGDFKGFLNLETQKLGVVQAYIRTQNGGVTVRMTAENRENQKYLESLSKELISSLENSGFNNVMVGFETENSQNVFDENFKEHLEDFTENIASEESGFSAKI